MKFVLVLLLTFSPILHAETTCVSEAEIAKAMKDVDNILKISLKGMEQKALILYGNQKLNATSRPSPSLLIPGQTRSSSDSVLGGYET